jgi:phosphohistidine swiveling domain-containing protein
MTGAPRCIPIADADGVGAGGKAEGLARILRVGLPVPDGFVIVGATPKSLPDDLERAYRNIGGGRVAVRSSASDEDGTDVSFAGQHSTVLDVEGVPAVRDAIVHCLRSLESERVQAYRKMHNNRSNGAMSVVVQRMVDARCAGVIFTADPITARRDRMVVDAIAGLANQLVGGSVTPDHFTLTRDGSLVKSELSGRDSSLQHDELGALASAAVRVEQEFERPVDCEWAIDHSGDIVWLQARPITTLPSDPRELDSKLNPDEVYTSCNIGEVFPGVVTPLTWSTSMRANDRAMQRMYSRIATLKNFSEEPFLIMQSFGRPLFNLSELTAIARSMPGASDADAFEALCGRAVPVILPGPQAPRGQRAHNGLRFMRFLLTSRRNVDKLNQLIASIDLTPGGDARATYGVIDRELPKIDEAWYQHDSCTLFAGSLVGLLPRILAKVNKPKEEGNAEAARLLSGAEDVESLDIAVGIDRIVATLVEHDESELDHLLTLDAQAADRFLRNEASAATRREYTTYLERHGHRRVRELELREKAWAEDPTPIVKAVLSGMRAARAGRVTSPKIIRSSAPLTLRLLVRLGHRSIRDRERTKSQIVMIHALFKRAYRTLARQMVDEGLLPDEDLVFFLQHGELGDLLRDGNSKLVERALARREVLPYQMKLVFRQSFRGRDADPIDPPVPDEQGILRGKPVSRGIARGRVRVALTVTDAADVQPNEILITPIIDVGWTPTFATIAGFGSDVGGALSHGAVVAREYGLPTVVNLHNATQTFHTGDPVELDADHGVLRRLAEGDLSRGPAVEQGRTAARNA